MKEDEELAVIRAFYRIIENLETIEQLAGTNWSKDNLIKAREELKKFRGY